MGNAIAGRKGVRREWFRQTTLAAPKVVFLVPVDLEEDATGMPANETTCERLLENNKNMKLSIVVLVCVALFLEGL
jgi:hypothetical protein